jgi:hypothetical protein
MPQIRSWFVRLAGLFRKNGRAQEMAEELQQHLDALTERNIAAGMSPSEARRRGRSVAACHFARSATHDRRNCHRRNRRAVVDPFNEQSALQS